jgi:16S rRNA (adenine1518-N6/adenine1519-N6)-dimethyltransferase
MNQRQTLSYLSERLQQSGLRPKNKFGQNFLIDLNLLDILLKAAKIGKNDVILEVGTGTGSLTVRMAESAHHVLTVEIDEELIHLAELELHACDNVTLFKFDALKNKNRLREDLMAAVSDTVHSAPDLKFKLVANLPYNVATPIISNLLTTEPWPDLMVVTIQKELAERITAVPSTKDYSALSIWIQCQCDADIVRIMPPSVFWPRPQVDSAILRIKPNRAKRERIKDVAYFHQTVRSLFFHRRKFLRSTLISAMKDQLSKPEVDDVLAELGHATEARAEELTVEQMIELVETCRVKAESVKSNLD